MALAAVGWLWWRAGHPQASERAAKPVAAAKKAVAAPAKPEPVPAHQVVEVRTQRAEGPVPPLREPTPVAEPPQPSAQTNPPPAAPADKVPTPPTNPPAVNGFPRPVQNVFEAQLALARLGISCGPIDGRMGSQTRAGLAAFQRDAELPVTGLLDTATVAGLPLTAPAYTTYRVSAEDVGRLQPLSQTWLGKSQQTALEYETVLELVAEKTQTHPSLIRQLNPGINWNRVGVGTELQVPDVPCPAIEGKAAFLVISLAEKTLEAFDAETNLLAHFPCSIAQRVEKRPVGELHVAVIAPHPNYTFNPDVFPESAEARQLNRKLVLPPGPNNPVGSAWIGLDRAGYGIHGTPNPEQVGRTESHGCFRLANWNAEYLVRLAWVGLPVYVVK